MFKSTESRKKLYIVVLRLGIAFALLTSLFGFIVSMAAGETWSPLGDGTGADVYALAFNRSGNVYAGGNFTSAGSLVANSIAKWDGSAWSLLGSGLNNTVYALAVDGSGNLYAGGTFTTAGGVAANRVANGMAVPGYRSGPGPVGGSTPWSSTASGLCTPGGVSPLPPAGLPGGTVPPGFRWAAESAARCVPWRPMAAGICMPGGASPPPAA